MRAILALACAASLMTVACSSATPAASSLAGPTASGAVGTASTSSPTAGATATATTAPTPIPTLPSTTVAATVAPPGAIAITMSGLTEKPRFIPQDITARAGTVVFYLDNVRNTTNPVDHSMLIESKTFGALARTPPIANDHAAVFTVQDLKPGTYRFICEVFMHAQYGMAGTLTITP